MAVEYRKLSEADLEIFVGIRLGQLHEEGAEPVCDLAPKLMDYYVRHLENGTFVSYLAFCDRETIGTSGMSFVERPPYYGCPTGKMGILSSMYVAKEYRRQGIGRTLLDKVMTEAKNYGCDMVQITASDMGVLLYTDFGFKKNSNFMYYYF